METPILLEHPSSLREYCESVRRAGRTVGFVPTMGALHEGHRALVRLAARHATDVVVSIFVNPTQFGPSEDLGKYPRTLEADVTACGEEGVHAMFVPQASEMYPPGERTRVSVPGLNAVLCGVARPDHFDGVATVVAKLFALVGPCVAVFGRKDYQQLKLVERLTRDLMFPVDIVSHPIVRDADGLALSSRNKYLSPQERHCALGIVAALTKAQSSAAAGMVSQAILDEARQTLTAAGVRVDYAELIDPDSLEPVRGSFSNAVLAIAAYAGQTRLIDNALLTAQGASQ